MSLELYVLPLKVATKGEMVFLKKNCVQPDHVTDLATDLYEMAFHVGQETVSVLYDDKHNDLTWYANSGDTIHNSWRWTGTGIACPRAKTRDDGRERTRPRSSSAKAGPEALNRNKIGMVSQEYPKYKKCSDKPEIHDIH